MSTTTGTDTTPTDTATTATVIYSDANADMTGAGVAAVTMMMFERSTIDGHKQAVVRETAKVPYDVNDL